MKEEKEKKKAEGPTIVLYFLVGGLGGWKVGVVLLVELKT